MTITIHIGWILGIGVILIIMAALKEKNPLKWPVLLFGHNVYHTSILSPTDSSVDKWVADNVKYSKYTVLALTPMGWRKYFGKSNTLMRGYRFLFKSDAMAFKLRWL